MSHDTHHAHGKENKTIISFRNSFWLVVILVGLFIAALNFIQAESAPEAEEHGGGHEAKQEMTHKEGHEAKAAEHAPEAAASQEAAPKEEAPKEAAGTEKAGK